MKKETWHWTRKGELSTQITRLVKLVSEVAKTKEFRERFYSDPLLLDICADSEDDIFIKIDDNPDPTDEYDVDCDYVLFTSFGTPCKEYAKAIPRKYNKKIKDLLKDSIRFMHYLAKPCCKEAKKNARRVFVGSRASNIKNCPWCRKFCL